MTAEERARLETQLADARMAYHNLMTGQSARVVVDQNGERVEFVQANRAALYQYIVDLELKLAPPASNRRVLGPMGFTF